MNATYVVYSHKKMPTVYFQNYGKYIKMNFKQGK